MVLFGGAGSRMTCNLQDHKGTPHCNRVHLGVEHNCTKKLHVALRGALLFVPCNQPLGATG